MVSLSWWEQFIIGAAVSFLTVLASKITNPVELAALQAAIAFLQKLLGARSRWPNECCLTIRAELATASRGFV